MSESELTIEKVFQHAAPEADVVFVHGLTGDPVSTWTSKNGEFWPIWLTQSRLKINIWTVGYPAPLLAKFGQSGFTLFERGKSVLNGLCVNDVGVRPVLFVAHSLGGLVVKQTLTTASVNVKEDWTRLLNNTCSVTFLGTPHTGASLASVLTLAMPRLSSKNIDILSNKSGQLTELNESFRLLSEKFDFNTHVFYEMHRTLKLGMIVSKESADCGIAGVPTIGVDANHTDICKPKTKKSVLYLSIRKIVKEDLDRVKNQALDAKATKSKKVAKKRKKKRGAKAKSGGAPVTNITIVNEPAGAATSKAQKSGRSVGDDSGSRLVFEKLAERGSIDLRKLGPEPYFTEYDPDADEASNTADVYFAVPSVAHVLGARRHAQMPAICLCLKNQVHGNQPALVDKDIRRKLQKISMAKLFKEDKARLVENLHEHVHDGFIAGVTMPIRLFDSTRRQQRIRKTYDAMINSLASPVARLHAKLDFTRVNFHIMPIGEEQLQSKLVNVIESRLESANLDTRAATVSGGDSRGMVELMKFLSWCYGHAGNTGKTYWLDELQRKGN